MTVDKSKLRPMKAWLVYEGVPEWYSASFICENGAVPYGHVCSHECFVAGDLWGRRPERHRQMIAAGFAIEIQNDGKPMHVRDLPKEILALNKSNKAEIEAFYALLAQHSELR